MSFIIIIAYIFILFLGLCVGSFLNVVIYLLEHKKKLTGRSFCPQCKHQLSWQDLIPVLSFFYLHAKCRYCNKKISVQYPLVEIFTGIIFVLIFGLSDLVNFGVFSIINILFIFYISSALIVIFVYDLKHYLIPDKILFPAIIIAFLYRLIVSPSSFLNFLLAALLASGFFFMIFLLSKGHWMGFGDVKLAVLMGLLLGVGKVLAALFLAFLIGAVVGTAMILMRKKNLKSEVPFAPFLILGTFISLLAGSVLINWYLSYLY